MTYFDIGTVQDVKFEFEPIPFSPKEKQWLEILEFIQNELLISLSFKLQESPKWQVEELDGEITIYGPSPIQESFPIIYKVAELQEIIERLKRALVGRGLRCERRPG